MLGEQQISTRGAAMRFLPDRFTTLLICTVLLASFLPIYGTAADWFDLATKCAIGLLFFMHGAKLSRAAVIAGFTHWRLHLFIVAVTFVVFPILGLMLGLLSPALLQPALYAGIMFICVLPSTVQSSIAFTSIAGGNVPAAIGAATLSNILGMLLTPLLVGLLISGHGEGFSFDIVGTILLQLLAPFVAGQILQPWISGFITEHKKVLTLVDRGAILMVVYLAFSEAVIGGLWRTLSISDFATMIITDMVLLFAVLVITTAGSRLLGFSREDEIAIVFCGSKKSLASGLPMASVIFVGQNVGAMVLPLIFFHQIQLMVCAVLARNYAAAGAKAEQAALSASAP
jgi:sodium/bile acid cotransporter 7